jgi:hypothetical protein
MDASTSSRLSRQIREVEYTIHRMLSDCLPHGFFTITIRGEKKTRGKVDVYVEGGQSVKHTIPLENTENQNDSWGGSVNDQNNT